MKDQSNDRNDSSVRVVPMARCPFCFELKKQVLPSSDRERLGIRNRIVYSTANFAVLVDISPLVPGHVLIVPKDHYLSFGNLPGDLVVEYEMLVETVRKVITSIWTPPVLMEHGSSNTQDGGACIAHAHLQVLPASLDMLRPMGVLRPRRLAGRRDVSAWGRADKPYMFLENAAGECYLADELDGLEHQFIRREAAAQLGIPEPEWDWRSTRRSELVRETCRTLREAPWKA